MLHKIDGLMGRMMENSKEGVWAIMRILASAMFMTHGYSKLFGENPQPPTGSGMTTVNIADTLVFAMPMDINALFVAGVIEFGGGFLLAIGLWTHIMAFLAVALMIMAYATSHLAWFPTLNRGELAAMYFVVYLVIFAFGPGLYSADAWLAERRQEKRQKKMDARQG